MVLFFLSFFFFFNDTATTEIYTLSLHDALPISTIHDCGFAVGLLIHVASLRIPKFAIRNSERSEEHTSELQSLTNLVCRLLLEKKKKKNNTPLFRGKDVGEALPDVECEVINGNR